MQVDGQFEPPRSPALDHFVQAVPDAQFLPVIQGLEHVLQGEPLTDPAGLEDLKMRFEYLLKRYAVHQKQVLGRHDQVPFGFQRTRQDAL